MGAPSHDRHGHPFGAARRISNELEQPRVWDLLQLASAQHKNFYEGRLKAEDVEEGLARVRELLGLLEGAAAQPFVPSPSQGEG